MNRAIYIHANLGFDRFRQELTWTRDAGFRTVAVAVEGLGRDPDMVEKIKRTLFFQVLSYEKFLSSIILHLQIGIFIGS